MNSSTILNYFQNLSEQLLNIEVTDANSFRLNLDEGARIALDMFAEVRSANQKIMIIGNGGSAAIASHAQNDLCGMAGMRAMVFTEQPLLTATANDYGYESIYQRSVKLWGEPKDLLLTISSSGQSENILNAITAAKENQCRIITLSGFEPNNPSRKSGDLNFYVPCSSYGLVESAHTALAHYLTTGLPPR